MNPGAHIMNDSSVIINKRTALDYIDGKSSEYQDPALNTRQPSTVMSPEERKKAKDEERESLVGVPRGRPKGIRSVTKPEYWNVTIKFHRGMDLLAKDEKGTSDPYAKVVPVSRSGAKMKNRAIKTAVVEETCSPSWDEELKLVLDTTQTQAVEVTIMDSNKHKEHESLGSFQIPMKALVDGSTGTKIYKLEGVERGRGEEQRILRLLNLLPSRLVASLIAHR
jgi:hypothetical protein